MANCKTCGVKIGLLSRSGELCLDCAAEEYQAGEGARVEAQRQTGADQAVQRERREAAIEAVTLTTETSISLNIKKRIEIVTAECAYGMNVFKDLFAAVRNVVGGRSEAVQSTMRDARKTALYELKREAYLVGANAVVGVDLDYVEVGSAGANMIMLVASGTAVVIEEKG